VGGTNQIVRRLEVDLRPLAIFRGPTSKGRKGGEEEGRKEGERGKKGRRNGGKGAYRDDGPLNHDALVNCQHDFGHFPIPIKLGAQRIISDGISK